MAAPPRTRSAYTPVSVEDTGQEALLRSNSRTSVSKPKRTLGVVTFSLVVICLCVLFLLGFCLGFYVRETQNSGEELNCDEVRKNNIEVPLTSLHDDMMYRIEGNKVEEFLEEFQYEDAVSDSAVERRLEQRVRQQLQDLMLDGFEVEEHDVAVSYSDPHRPNYLQIVRKDRNTVTNVTLQNDVSSDVANSSKPSGQTTTNEWKYPFVVYSPPGEVEGAPVYCHYGREVDLLVLQANRISLKNRVVLMRLGKVSLAEKVRNVAQLQAAGVLVYWDPEDVEDNGTYPDSPSYIPYSSALLYSRESSKMLVPTIPVQTISRDLAAMIFRHLHDEEGMIPAPSAWAGGLDIDYFIGQRSNGGNVTVRLTVFNKQTKKIVRNIISNIHGTVEKDRYIIIGAPRACLPGGKMDSMVSTALLMQVARSLHTAHELKQYKPRRGIKIISWGGADIGNIGMLEYIQSRHYLLLQKAVAYFDISQLVAGNEVIAATLSPGLYQVLHEVLHAVPDPRHSEINIQSQIWEENVGKGLVQDRTAVYLHSFPSDRSEMPFVNVLGVSTVSLQYRHSSNPNDHQVSMKLYEQHHHYKFHVAVVRTMMQIMLSMADDDIVPYSLSGAAAEITQIMDQSSDALDDCSSSMQDLHLVVEKCRELEQTAAVFEDLIAMYKERKDIQSYRAVNDVKMLFERVFVRYSQGISGHVLYPFNDDQVLTEIADFCEAGDIAEVWEAAEDLSFNLHAVITEAISTMRATN